VLFRSNFNVVQLAYDWAAEKLVKADPFVFEPMNETEGKILITGNEAGALGAIFGGCHMAAWYPITPSTSFIDGMITYRHLRKDPETGKDTLAIIQAEDELAAAGMIIGAGFSGARSLTATSGPGISLMAEFVGLAYFSEIPCVFWDITRMGPSTGMPTRTSQGDLFFIHFLGHGDTRQVALMPASPEEAFAFGWQAFDIADKFQTPIFVISDLDLGMNNWMAQPFAYPDQPINRGKVLDADSLRQFIAQHGKWGRYRDVDGDGIGYRTIPGTDHPQAGYFARGTGHDEMAVYTEDSAAWMQNMHRLTGKIESTRNQLPAPIIEDNGASVGIVTFGSNEPAAQEARDYLASQGVQTDYMRVRALPLADSVKDFVLGHERVFVVENNYDGQLNQILRVEYPEDLRHVTSLALGDGLPMTADFIVDGVLAQVGAET
jgi:2-oxoglutarate/2-oxoacid ferredoxin oxidoreductase subunit alpha